MMGFCLYCILNIHIRFFSCYWSIFHMCLASIWQFLGLGGVSKGNRNYYYLWIEFYSFPRRSGKSLDNHFFKKVTQRSLKDAITVSDKETTFEFNYIKLPFTKERPKVVLGVYLFRKLTEFLIWYNDYDLNWLLMSSINLTNNPN